MTTQTIRSGTPESFGWLRRPLLDQEGARAYEEPTGRLFLIPDETPVLHVIETDGARKFCLRVGG